ncbi:hypothetical protein [Terrisporobacter glycolicus]|uniref:Uncharacterized protein n=1 Tax=Terrisporobacter glycolicus ATCC 14880 = DSM 1288 TaxID=1121315 RepID=A0ABZ2ETR7_9FIRM|nr:hypothetical protein [Terrisporobacter glycolicus]
MKKKCILVSLLLISLIVTNNYTSFAEQSELSVPPMYKNLKGKDELLGFLNEIETLRANINTIIITPVAVKDNSSKIKREINFYISQLISIENSIKMFEKKYNNSPPDLLFSQQISILLNAYKMSLNQQLALIDGLINNEVEAAYLFHSQYLTYIYYYLNLGDQMISYIETFYNL